jgi:hypothetical protein
MTLGQKIKKRITPDFFHINAGETLILVAFIMTPILVIGFELSQRKKVF